MPRLAILVALCLVSLTANFCHAEALGPDSDAYQGSIERAVNFLKTSQADDGSWTAPTQVGITALVTTSLLVNGVPADDPTAAKAMQYLESYIQDDGGIYHPETRHKRLRGEHCRLAPNLFAQSESVRRHGRVPPGRASARRCNAALMNRWPRVVTR